MTKLAITLLLTLLGTAFAQNLGTTIQGVYGETLGSATTVDIPNYGRHAVVRLTTTQIEPVAAREMALGVFTALASTRPGTTSVSVHGRAGFGQPEFVLLFQMLDGSVSVYLDGEPFDP